MIVKAKPNIHHLFSLSYSFVEVTQGLFFHPYQTMQFLVRGNYFVVLIFLPILLFSFEQITIFLLVNKFNLIFHIKILTFIRFFFEHLMLIWQSVLIYLFFRFKYAWKNKL
ncbi:MAG: hypothetical protein COU63_03715 [Candidatus Pacebacteria bacterium CG10_big_fil_rev_8_21_14_0_10_36_11]|nr:hypothetical protein [Candidatus Pacearchaeota archaeon]OIP73867.1 MAG: hypothetical protein AUK08_04915 [Candidatus Pacebacteria bacterium CG2_30_36_39]PIR64569.1 MAG: hypothetical protein COU63_03715 [Candidatus Pacebacteria bacterium CG10_big_fil_rev_8_21_14_0_10_36_11]PJC42992.1 MAG: hypothetical protein CO040_01475 [Candidatus Pacebacteria bacterium CG_4_9_14_0_2_um_filter_36_8]